MYGKLFASMYDGSLYGNWQALVTFQQMIVLCGPDGVIDMTPQALAARTSIPLDVIQAGIKVLEAPDQYSRTPDEDGRRIERLDDHRPWGWRIVNYRKYRLMVDAETVREQNRVRQQRRRDKLAAKSDEPAAESPAVTPSHAASRPVTHVTAGHAESRQAEAEAEVEAIPPPQPSVATGAAWQAYAAAYQRRYGIPPIRNARVNAWIKTFVGRVGAEVAPQVAEFFVSCETPYYIRRAHSADLLCQDAEQLVMRWRTGAKPHEPLGRQSSLEARNAAHAAEFSRRIREQADAVEAQGQ
jgi:hypothetical protein